MTAANGPICVLLSGGLDSAVLTWACARDGTEVHPVYVRTGMKWESVELVWMQRYLARIKAPNIRAAHELALPLADVYGAHWSLGSGGSPGYDAPDAAVYLPGRNIILLSKTAVYCALSGIERIAIGVLAGNPFPDASPEFFDSWAAVLTQGLAAPIRIERPFAALHKADVVRLGAHLPLELTFTCNNAVGELHCGDCNKCAERQQGFREAEVPDPTEYVKAPH